MTGVELTRAQQVQAYLRRLNKCLDEALDLTRQLADAVDRSDQTSIQLVLTMRDDPLREAAELRDNLRRLLDEEPAEESERLKKVLDGAPAKTEEERILAYQAASNRRLLEQLGQLDEGLSRKIAREKSFYNKK